MEDKLPVTTRLVLAGLAPGLTMTVSSVLLPEITLFGLARPVPVGDVVQEWRGAELLRGLGATATKSLELSSVSVQPPFFRWTQVVLPGAGVGAVSEQLAVGP